MGNGGSCCGSGESNLTEELCDMVLDHRRFLIFIVNKSEFANPTGDSPASRFDVIVRAMREYQTALLKGGAQSKTPLSKEALFAQHVHRLNPLRYRHDMNSLERTGRVQLDLNAMHEMIERQLVTAAKMAVIGPTEETRKLLVKKYLQFLDLAKAQRGQMVVPTLAIDMVWHAHMNHPRFYAEVTMKRCGFVLDHNDDVPDDQLETHRATTRAAWNGRFKDPYDQPFQLQLLPMGSSVPSKTPNGEKQQKKEQRNESTLNNTASCCTLQHIRQVSSSCTGIGGCGASGAGHGTADGSCGGGGDAGGACGGD